MRLEVKFIKVIFFPFIIGIVLSFSFIVAFLYNYGYKYLDKKTQSNIFEAQLNLTYVEIYSVCTLLYRYLQKSQLLLEELSNTYIFFANNKDNYGLGLGNENIDPCNFDDNPFLKNGEYLSKQNIDELRKDENSNKTGFWFITKETEDLNCKNLTSEAKKQLNIFYHMNLFLYSSHQTDTNTINFIYFAFDKTNLITGFPLSSALNDKGMIESFGSFKDNPSWCKDFSNQQFESESSPEYYVFKCREWYLLLNKTSSEHEMREIFVLPPYRSVGNRDNVLFTQCIKFTDPISSEKAFICIDHNPKGMFEAFDIINSQILGHFFITSVNTSHNPFYYENLIKEPRNKPLSAFEFSENESYYLEELLYFNDEITETMTKDYSNYVSSTSSSSLGLFQNIDTEHHINYFTKNGKRFNFTIFPFLRYFKNQYLDELNIIYVYQEEEFLNKMFSYQRTFKKRLNLILIIFIYISLCLILIVWWSLVILAKYIAIPIKNVQYMLKGINIGGENRLRFLEALETKEANEKKQQLQYKLTDRKGLMTSSKDVLGFSNTLKEEQQNLLMNPHFLPDQQGKDMMKRKRSKKESDVNLAFDNNINMNLNNNNTKSNNDNISNVQINVNVGSEYNNISNNIEQQDRLLSKDEEIFLAQNINSRTTLEKERHFYNFDEGLLEYRPREINGLVNLLLDLKQALILTSKTHHSNKPNEKIIEYSTSQCTFENVKNKEGSYICQSNIGNLNFLCFYYDKAIYHLCLSLQIPHLKKFLSKTLNDELDVSDSLLHLIDSQYNKNFPKEITNQLVKQQQQRSAHQTYSQKSIGNLINTRYNKLIHIYFKFFSMLKKSKRKVDDLNGMYLHNQYTTIPHFHKVLIQYVYLCYVSNDLVKIGESVLDYIEFLLKFKLSSIKSKKDIYSKHLSNIPYYKNIQELKKGIFNKISNWFDLYDHYVTHVSENTTLGNDKCVIDLYNNNTTSNTSTNNNEVLNSKSHDNGTYQNQSVFLFKINIQRGNFLKGKFAFKCKDYTDAVHYFTLACSNSLLVYDGLIKRKALQNLNKLIIKLEKKLKKNMFQGNNNKLYTDNVNGYLKDISIIKNEMLSDLGNLRTKRAKDLIVIIDKGHIKEDSELNAYVDEAKNILENYLTHNDRFGLFIFEKDCRIICPLTHKKDIDVDMVWNYMKNYSKTIPHDEDNESNDDDSGESMEFFKEGMTGTNMINSLNYCLNYLLIKMGEVNDKYMIMFTNYLDNDSKVEVFSQMKRERNVTYIFVCKFREEFGEFNDVSKFFEGCGKDSEFVDFNNMKEIKNILERNITINEIVFPNEIYESTNNK